MTMIADDIKLKYLTECTLRQTAEADLQNLNAILDKVTVEKSDLEMQYESLTEELSHLKKNLQEAKTSLQNQSSGDVTVEVNSGPGLDLKERLNDLRHEYEQIIENNRCEIERWYEKKVDEVRQVNSNNQETDCTNKTVMDLDRQYQTLSIELQSQLSILLSLKSNLIDIEGSYNMQLQHFASKIEPVEAELASIKCDIQSQNQEYQTLLGIKTLLEQEIYKYRQLLEEGKQLVAPQGGCDGDSGSGSFGGISGGGQRRQQSYGGISQGGGGQSCGGISQGGGQRIGQSCSGISQGGGCQSYGGISQGGGRQSCCGVSQGGGGQTCGEISQRGSGQCQSSCQAQSGSCGCCGQQGCSQKC